MHALRFFSVVLLVLLLAAGGAAAPANDFDYERAELKLTIDGRAPGTNSLEHFLRPELERSYELVDTAANDRHLIVTLQDIPTPIQDPATGRFQVSVAATLEFFQGDENLKGKSLNLGKGRLLVQNAPSVAGVGEATSAAECVEAALADLAGSIVAECAKYFPTLGTVRRIDGNLAELNRGSDHGLRSGQVCEVRDETGRKVGVLRIRTAEASSSEAEVLKGADRIEAGNTFQSRVKPLITGIIAEYLMVPMKSEIGSVYKQVAPTNGLADLTSAQGYRIAVCSYLESFFASIGGGVLHMDGKNPLFIDAMLGYQVFLSYDRLSWYIQAGAGGLRHAGQPYARFTTQDYDDPLGDSGNTGRDWMYIARGGTGFRLLLNSSVSFTAEVSYFSSGRADTPDVEYSDGTNSEYLPIEPAWAEYSRLQADGVGVSAGVIVLFNRN